jgi:hypothetical protein
MEEEVFPLCSVFEVRSGREEEGDQRDVGLYGVAKSSSERLIQEYERACEFSSRDPDSVKAHCLDVV